MPSRTRIEVICSRCGAETVYAYRDSEKALIRCEACKHEHFAYYTDPDRQRQETPNRFERHALIKEGERHHFIHLPPQARAIYEVIQRALLYDGYAPTLREIQDKLGMKSPNHVRHYLRLLEALHLIERDYGVARGIRLVG